MLINLIRVCSVRVIHVMPLSELYTAPPSTSDANIIIASRLTWGAESSIARTTM